MRHQTLQVGKIVNTHGLRGEVKVVPWTDTPQTFEAIEYVHTNTKSGKLTFTIDAVKYQKSNVLLKLRGIDSIDEAAKLRNQILYVDRSQLGEPEEGYYICDLLGIRVVTDDGQELGKIVDVFPTGANSVYVVRPPREKDILLPAIPDVVLSVDIDNEIAIVHLLEGLVDD